MEFILIFLFLGFLKIQNNLFYCYKCCSQNNNHKNHKTIFLWSKKKISVFHLITIFRNLWRWGRCQTTIGTFQPWGRQIKRGKTTWRWISTCTFTSSSTKATLMWPDHHPMKCKKNVGNVPYVWSELRIPYTRSKHVQ